MKRMELQISLTFVIMCVVGIILSGIISVISGKTGFITNEVLVYGISAGLMYLGFIWIWASRHLFLALVSTIAIELVILQIILLCKNIAGVSVVFDAWNLLQNIVLAINCVIGILISKYQAKKLLEEDNKKSKNPNIIFIILDYESSIDDVESTND